jgi:hypothetical protein
MMNQYYSLFKNEHGNPIDKTITDTKMVFLVLGSASSSLSY